MPFDGTYLTLVGPAGNSKAGRMWKYFTEDANTAIDGAGYFNSASDLLGVGDTVQWCTINSLAADPLVVGNAGTVIVLSNAAGVVDTSDESALVITDSD